MSREIVGSWTARDGTAAERKSIPEMPARPRIETANSMPRASDIVNLPWYLRLSESLGGNYGDEAVPLHSGKAGCHCKNVTCRVNAGLLRTVNRLAVTPMFYWAATFGKARVS